MGWSLDDETLLIRKWNEGGLTGLQIATLLPRYTRNAVIAKVWRLRQQGVFMREVETTAHEKQSSPMKKKKQHLANKKSPHALGPRLKPAPIQEIKDELAPLVVNTNDLEAHHCRWPYGDPREATFAYCGRHRMVSAPYCEAHAKRAYAQQPYVPVAQRFKDATRPVPVENVSEKLLAETVE